MLWTGRLGLLACFFLPVAAAAVEGSSSTSTVAAAGVAPSAPDEAVAASAGAVEGGVEAAVSAAPRMPRTDGRFGVDLRLGLSNGMLGAPANVGVDFVYVPWAPVGLYAGFDTNGATVAGHIDAQVNLLTFFKRTPWTPFIRAGYSQFWFTGLADEILDAAAPELQDDLANAGTGLTFEGVHMHLVQVGGGIDLVSRGGFHFQMLVGRSFMLGESQGRDSEESVVFTEYQAWNATFAFGWLFR